MAQPVNILVMQSGGSTPVLNRSLFGVVQEAAEHKAFVCHHGEVLGRDAVALGGVAVPPEGGAYLALLVGGQHDGAADVPGRRFLKYASVDYLYGSYRHAYLLLYSASETAARSPPDGRRGPPASRLSDGIGGQVVDLSVYIDYMPVPIGDA